MLIRPATREVVSGSFMMCPECRLLTWLPIAAFVWAPGPGYEGQEFDFQFEA